MIKQFQLYQLPAAYDIYDFDTDELIKIKQQIIKSFAVVTSYKQRSSQEDQWIENANRLKNILELEIEQRKAVEDFGKMCMDYKYPAQDNKNNFLQKFEDFNRQFQALAMNVFQNKSSPNIDSNTQILFPPIDTKTSNANHYVSNDSNYTTQKTQATSVKMGFNNNKKRKSDKDDMIMKLFARTKVQDTHVAIGKANIQKTVQTKHVIQAPTEVIKSVKSTGQKKQVKVTGQDNKKISENVINSKSKQISTKEIKNSKEPARIHKEIEPKINSTKLVEMIKKEEQEKTINKQKKVQQDKQTQIEMPTSKQITMPVSIVTTTETVISTPISITESRKEHQIQQNNTQHVEIKQNSIVASKQNSVIKEINTETQNKKNTESFGIKDESIMKIQQNTVLKSEKELVAKKIEKETKQNLEKLTQKDSKITLETQNSIKQIQNSLSTKSLAKVESKTIIVESILHSNENTIQFQKLEKQQIKEQITLQDDKQESPKRNKNQLKARIIRTTISASSNTKAVHDQIQTKSSKTKLREIEQINFDKIEKRIEDSSSDDEPLLPHLKVEKPKTSKGEEKECYSEDYWNNVKQQAINNLEKMRKLKFERELEKQILEDQAKKAFVQANLQMNAEEILLNKNIIQKQQVIQKEVPNEIKKTTKPSDKKTSKAPIAKKVEPIQTIVKQLPAFIENYLQIYPTFHHIFAPIYLKPQAQAVLDTITLMKEYYALFSIHKETFDSKDLYKKPMFSAFDNHNTMYLNDPRQLLLHAQTTHIDLKVLIDRLNVFNENLHGRFQDLLKDLKFYRVIKSRQEVYDIITTSFLRTKSWRQLPHGHNLKNSWNLLWTWSKPEIDINKLLVFQKVNHFPFNKNLSRKDLLYKNIENFKKVFKISVNFLPLTFNLPKEFTQFSIKFHDDQISQGEYNIWIMKPIGKSRGRGIKLVNNIADLNYVDNIVVQKYLKNPLLLDGYKFDMRIYVLVTNLHPLEAFVYKQGFARLSTQKFNLQPQFIKNTFIHLTNFAIQKNNLDAKINNSNFVGGSKISLKTLQQQLQSKGIRWKIIWEKVHDIIIKSLLACATTMPNYPSAFELFGYDIMIDEDLNCYLIEINASPSLERSYLIDEIIKQSLIDDIISIVDPVNFDRQECCNVFTERMNRKVSGPKEDNIDIARIVKFKKIRKVGELPNQMGLFERVAPEKRSEELQKIVNSKYNPNIRNIDT